MKTFETSDGTVDLANTTPSHNGAFGYTLWEGVVDPKNPEGPRAIAMHIPAHSQSKVWELVKEGYRETIELLEGTASLVVHRRESEEWTTMPLTPKNPTADNIAIGYGDQFCIIADSDDAAVVLSRPSIDFELSFERDITTHPNDELSRFVMAQAVSAE